MKSIDEILNTICLDERITEGVFFMEDNNHMDILQEFLTKNGINETDSIFIRNKMVEGKYPERQAYNVNGILVTFPTPEYKQKAIQRGTHFEENPKKGEVNIFQGDKSATPTTPTTPTEQPTKTEPEEPSTPEPTQVEIPAPEIKPQQNDVPLEDDSEELDIRTAEEKQEDAKAVEMMLSDAPATVDISKNYPNISESLIFTLREAKQCNFYEKGGNWYNSEGKYVGKKWFCESTSQILIIP